MQSQIQSFLDAVKHTFTTIQIIVEVLRTSSALGHTCRYLGMGGMCWHIAIHDLQTFFYLCEKNTRIQKAPCDCSISKGALSAQPISPAYQQTDIAPSNGTEWCFNRAHFSAGDNF